MNTSFEATTTIETMFPEFETTLSSIHREEFLEMPAPDFDLFDEQHDTPPQNRFDTGVLVDLAEALTSVQRIIEGNDDLTILQPIRRFKNGRYNMPSINCDLSCHKRLKHPLKLSPVGDNSLEILSELVDNLGGFSSHSTECLFATASTPVVVHGGKQHQEASNGGIQVDENTLEEILSREQALLDELDDSFLSTTASFEDDTQQSWASLLKNKRVAAELTPGAPNHQFPLHQFKKQRCELTEDQSFWNSPLVEKASGSLFRSYKEEQWYIKIDELVAYKRIHGHCQVPHGYPPNPTLARWAKRQRYQYKRKQEANKHSTMTDERIAALENLGFVWETYTAHWFERLDELRAYKMIHGDCNVPSIYPPNPKMAIWVKCQRRQNKLRKSGQSSHMTHERSDLLNQIDFIWEVRKT